VAAAALALGVAFFFVRSKQRRGPQTAASAVKFDRFLDDEAPEAAAAPPTFYQAAPPPASPPAAARGQDVEMSGSPGNV
jgi:hypothetical protein